jgi:hypothetical protein
VGKKSILDWAAKHDMSIYATNAGPTMMGLITRAQEATRKSRSSAEDEIALARATLSRLATVWSSLLEAENHEEHKLTVEKLIREASALIVNMVGTDAKTRLVDAGAVNISTLSWLVAEVTRAIDEVIRDRQPELADELVARIEKIKVPDDSKLSSYTSKVRDESYL